VTTGDNPPALDDPRVTEALEEYLAALEAGQRPSRQAFLARHPAIADALAECLAGLDALHEASAPAAPPAAPAEWQPGTPLGDFRIVREIGRGGMGVVYEAEQLSLGRRIALKMLPFALTLDPRQLQRFKNEARAAAQLHHTNIVPIYSVGCERGVHFYAMQYIEGQTLAEVIAELRRLGGRETAGDEPTSPYVAGAEAATADTIPERPGALATAYSAAQTQFFRSVVQLGVQAAEALEHAHGYGVVHRDIKPGNLLVDGHGHLWVTDFGLAQFHSDAALTLTGDLLGTLRYMSPEQALARRGLVDHRTDIYSLGATLYELLTLEPACNGGDRETVLRQIAFEEPRPPRRLNPAIPADLETILLKAMARSVEERYATARELADDLRRFLENKPIRARRPALRERAAKWARRHKEVVVTAVLGLLLAAIGFATSTALVAREQWKTEAAYEAEAAQRTRAEDNFIQARQAVDFLTQVSAEDLPDRPEVFETRRKLLEGALRYYQEFIDQHQDDPSIRDDLAASRARVAQILDDLAAQQEYLRSMQLGMLLAEGSVQDYLRLTRAQREQVQKLPDQPGRKQSEAFREARKLAEEERGKQFKAMAAASEKAIAAVLTAEQVRRLKQIALQQRSPQVFGEPEVIEALALTPGQQQKIRELADEARPWPGGPPPFRGVPGPDARRRREPSWKSATEQVLGLLTAEQKARWNELAGEPFKGELPVGFGGPFGPGRDFPGRRRP
jgi:serine/threonine protein kinase